MSSVQIPGLSQNIQKCAEEHGNIKLLPTGNKVTYICILVY